MTETESKKPLMKHFSIQQKELIQKGVDYYNKTLKQRKQMVGSFESYLDLGSLKDPEQIYQLVKQLHDKASMSTIDHTFMFEIFSILEKEFEVFIPELEEKRKKTEETKEIDKLVTIKREKAEKKNKQDWDTFINPKIEFREEIKPFLKKWIKTKKTPGSVRKLEIALEKATDPNKKNKIIDALPFVWECFFLEQMIYDAIGRQRYLNLSSPPGISNNIYKNYVAGSMEIDPELNLMTIISRFMDQLSANALRGQLDRNAEIYLSVLYSLINDEVQFYEKVVLKDPKYEKTDFDREYVADLKDLLIRINKLEGDAMGFGDLDKGPLHRQVNALKERIEKHGTKGITDYFLKNYEIPIPLIPEPEFNKDKIEIIKFNPMEEKLKEIMVRFQAQFQALKERREKHRLEAKADSKIRRAEKPTSRKERVIF